MVPEYKLAEREREKQLTVRAESLAAEARDANQTGDNYVLTTVLFASVLFFAGISSKFESLRNHSIMIVMAVVLLIAGMTIVATYPIEI